MNHKEIGWADELGSGIRNLYQYCDAYCGHLPQLNERDIFTFTLTINEQHATTPKVASALANDIVILLIENEKIRIAQLAETLNIPKRTIEYQIRKLKDDKRIKRVGSSQKGKWVVLD